MLRYLHIGSLFLRIGALTELEYRANFFIQIFQSVVSLIISLGGLAVIFENTDSLNGWHPNELLVVVGVYFLIGGWVKMIVQPSLTRFMNAVRTGTLDFTLIKPVDAQFMVSIWQPEIWNIVDVLIGLGIIGVAVARIGSSVQAVPFALMLLAGGAIIYSFWLILASLTFWFISLDNTVIIFESMFEAGRWPVGIYPAWLRYALTFFVPVAFAVTIPAEALTGRLSNETLVGALVLAAALLLISRAFWRYGVRHYSGASA